MLRVLVRKMTASRMYRSRAHPESPTTRFLRCVSSHNLSDCSAFDALTQREPGPEDEPGPHFPSHGSWGNKGPLPVDGLGISGLNGMPTHVTINNVRKRSSDLFGFVAQWPQYYGGSPTNDGNGSTSSPINVRVESPSTQRTRPGHSRPGSKLSQRSEGDRGSAMAPNEVVST
jgi:hypothetical protein